MKKKPRVSAIDFGGIALEIDADKDWQKFQEMPPRERVLAASTDFHFLIHLGWMDLPDPIKHRFMHHFTAESASAARQVALDGLVAANHQNEWNLIWSAMQFHGDRTAGKFINDPKFATSCALGIAVAFSEMVAKRDPAAFRRLVAIIEAGGMPEGDRGGIGSEDGLMLEKFAELHAKSRSLPTKKDLREACGLNANERKKTADKRMKKLGLWGLPTEPEL